jgi:hypothetical protein
MNQPRDYQFTALVSPYTNSSTAAVKQVFSTAALVHP